MYTFPVAFLLEENIIFSTNSNVFRQLEFVVLLSLSFRCFFLELLLDDDVAVAVAVAVAAAVAAAVAVA